MIMCHRCGENPAAQAIRLCADCLRNSAEINDLLNLHDPFREEFGLPVQPPKDPDGVACRFCSNNCQIGQGETGFCGLRRNERGRVVNTAPKGSALAYMYLDPLPSNCCAAWFCSGSQESGYNLAVFFYGCNFDCLFCQNASHKLLKEAHIVTTEEMVQAALNPRVRCVCFFGGSPEPQFPFVISVARKILEKSNNAKHICWEWNGCGNPKMVHKAAATADISDGTVKFDLKAFHPNISQALCGVDNGPAFANFTRIAGRSQRQDLLTATTLLVPFYVDEQEIENIARYIAEINPDFPYSLLVFHPDFYLNDLPITPRKQVDECYQTARKYLTRVNIGNKHLLSC